MTLDNCQRRAARDVWLGTDVSAYCYKTSDCFNALAAQMLVDLMCLIHSIAFGIKDLDSSEKWERENNSSVIDVLTVYPTKQCTEL